MKENVSLVSEAYIWALKVPCFARMPLRTCHVVKEGPFREVPLTAMGDGLREHGVIEDRFGLGA